MENVVDLRFKTSLLRFYSNKNVFVTGHTGFKGFWLCKILKMLGANITGYSLNPQTELSLFKIANVGENIDSIIGNIRDLSKFNSCF